MITTNWIGRVQKIWNSKKMILRVCTIGAAIGLIISFGTPKEYTAKIFIAPENTRRSSSSSIDALGSITGFNSSSSDDRDAIYPSLYPVIINSTPFLIRLFDIKVCEQKDSTTITLNQYLKERQKRPWWNVITSVPSKLVSSIMSLFKRKPEAEKRRYKSDSNSRINLFQLTREEAGIVGAIASRINVGVDREKRTITLFVTMQDPLVAATVVDTVSVYLREYITEYRTSKARRILKYNEELCKEAQAAYYAAQDKYTRYADANQSLTMLTSRTELTGLRNEMNLAYTTFNQTVQQVQAAKARVEKVTPVYAVIQPAIVPLAPSKPRKLLIIAACILLSGAGSIGWVLFVKDFLGKIKKRRMIDCIDN